MSAHKPKRCNPADPSTEHSDAELRDQWIMDNGVEQRTKGKATYFVCPNRAEMGRQLFPGKQNPAKRMRDIDRHAAERQTLNGDYCGLFVDLQRKNKAGKTVSIYTFHDAKEEVKWFLHTSDMRLTVDGMIQRIDANITELSRWVVENIPVLLHHARDAGDFEAFHIYKTVVEEHRDTGTVSTRTLERLQELWRNA